MRKVNEVEVVEWKEWQISLRGLRLGPCLALRLRLRLRVWLKFAALPGSPAGTEAGLARVATTVRDPASLSV
jgi:hypothetical protein